jgi:hypothetical protein
VVLDHSSVILILNETIPNSFEGKITLGKGAGITKGHAT